MRELRELGLPRLWLEVAAQLGCDTFLALWRLIDHLAPPCDAGSVLKVTIRGYSSYLRHQRNRYIEALARAGASNEAIARAVRAHLGDQVSDRTIRRVAGRARGEA